MLIVELFISFVPERFQKTTRQFLKFGIIGAIGFVVDFSVYIFLTRILDWDTIYYLFSYEIIAANLVSVPLAICSNFILNKYWTFKDKDKAVAKQWGAYFAFNTVTFVLNQVLTSFFAFRLDIVADIFGSQKDFAAKALAIGLILFINFLGSKFLVFRKKGKT